MGIIKMSNEDMGNYTVDIILNVVTFCICVIVAKIQIRYHYKYQSSNNSMRESLIENDKNIDNIKKDSDSKSFWIKLKETVVSYIFSPFFVLHFCRLGLILWIYNYSNYPTIGLLIWLFYSFNILSSRYMKVFTFIIVWPILLYSYNAFMIANIPKLMDLSDKDWIIFSLYGINKFDQKFWNFLFVQIIILLFTIFSRNLVDSNRNAIKSDNNNQIEITVEGDHQSQKKDEKQTKISFLDLILKLIITNIDKITLVFMYLVAIKTVNLSHFSNINIINYYSPHNHIFNSINSTINNQKNVFMYINNNRNFISTRVNLYLINL
jgi:hypothetical protein